MQVIHGHMAELGWVRHGRIAGPGQVRHGHIAGPGQVRHGHIAEPVGWVRHDQTDAEGPAVPVQ